MRVLGWYSYFGRWLEPFANFVRLPSLKFNSNLECHARRSSIIPQAFRLLGREVSSYISPIEQSTNNNIYLFNCVTIQLIVQPKFPPSNKPMSARDGSASGIDQRREVPRFLQYARSYFSNEAKSFLRRKFAMISASVVFFPAPGTLIPLTSPEEGSVYSKRAGPTHSLSAPASRF
jgi:hypothetical protein